MSRWPARVLIAVLAVVGLSASACSSSKGQSPAEATAQITTAWQTFFSAAGSPDQIQGMTPQLRSAFAKAKPPAGLSARVSHVQLETSSFCKTNQVPAPCAEVTYDLVAGGTPLLSNSKGYATRVGGKWLVSKTTFCALEALGNNNTPPAGC